MKIDASIVKAAKKYVKNYLAEQLGGQFGFHNLDHTVAVVNAVNLICFEIGINEHDHWKLQVAAWFHDLGYTERIDKHEDVGAALAEKFLETHDIDRKDIEAVKQYIIATHYPQRPLTLQEKILCDADMAHLAEKKYTEHSQVLRREWEVTRNKVYTDKEWLQLNIEFLSQHSFQTIWCRENMESQKQKNIQKLVSTLSVLDEENSDDNLPDESAGRKKNKKSKQYEYGRGVETFFRITSNNHMRLSGMADNKAHILLSINSIIISVVISVLAKKITEAHYLIFPTAFLVCVCLTTMVFAVLTTRPKVSRKRLTDEEIGSRQMNLLFFGHFHQMKPDVYHGSIDEVLRDKDYLYKTLAKDVYHLGKILAVKYRYLSIGYMIFMLGLIAAVVVFGVSFFISHQAI